MNPLEKLALTGARLTTAAHGIAAVAQIVYLLWASRLLGPEAIGRYQLVVIAVTLVALLADLGLGDALVRDRRRIGAILPPMMRGILLASTALVVVAYAVAGFVPALRETAFVVALLGVLWVPLFDGPAYLVEKGLHREFSFKRVASIEAGTQILHTALGALLVGLWRDVSAMLVAFAAYRVTRALLLALALRTRGVPLLRGGESRWIDAATLRFGGQVVTERALSHVNSRLDRILLGALAGEAMVGFYTLGRQLFVEPVLRTTPILVTVAQPLLARVQDDLPTFRRYLVQVYKAVTALLAPALLGMWVVHGGILEIVLDPQWAPVATIALPLALSALLRIYVVPSSISAIARGWAGRNVRMALVYFGALLVLPTAGYLLGGFAGFAWGILATSAVHVAAIATVIVVRGHGIGTSALLAQLRGPLLASLAMAGIVTVVREALGPWTVTHLALCIGSGALAYPLALAVFDRRYLRWILREGLTGGLGGDLRGDLRGRGRPGDPATDPPRRD